MRAHLAIGAGAPCPLPYELGEPPKNGFYPIAITPKQYANFYLKTQMLQLGSEPVTIGSDTFYPLPFQRHFIMPSDERRLMMFPGACNYVHWDGGGPPGINAFSGELSIGWCGGFTPLNPGIHHPDGNSWPPQCAGQVYWGLGFGDELVADVAAAYYHDGLVYPFIWIWFNYEGPGGVRLYVSNPQFPNPGSADLVADALTLQLFDWPPVPMTTLGFGPIATIDAAQIDLIATQFYEYAKADGTAPAYDIATGAPLRPLPRDTTGPNGVEVPAL